MHFTRFTIGQSVAVVKGLTPFVTILFLTVCGCGAPEEPVAEKDKVAQPAKAVKTEKQMPKDQSSVLPDSKMNLNGADSGKDSSKLQADESAEDEKDRPGKQDDTSSKPAWRKDLVQLDEALIESCGIRKIDSKHLTVYTDVPDSKGIEAFPKVFEQAVPFWASYFDIDESKTRGWKMVAFVIVDKERFAKAKILTSNLPAFATGYQSGRMMWIYRQEGDYYTRHLLLHEGTHGFMEHFLRGYGPAWYSEGMAEMLAVHRWHDQKLQMNYRLKDKSEAENWGRVRIIQDAYREQRALSLEQAMTIEPNEFFHAAEPYAWTWAACYFLSQHPLSREAFAKLPTQAKDGSRAFTIRLLNELESDWDPLQAGWQLFIDEMEYGYDVAAASIVDVETVVDTVSNKRMVIIDPKRGWHRTDLELKKGYGYAFRASGEFEVANLERDGKRETWKCQPNGITIEYHRGKPLGMLVAGEDSFNDKGQTLLLDVTPAYESGYHAKSDGKLCLRVNESPARLGDNSGKVRVEILIYGKPGQKR